MANKERYLNNLELDQLVAFNACGKMLSGKVKAMNGKIVELETKNGIRYIIKHEDIAWVKTGERWPKGIYVELKKSVGDGDVRID